LVYHAVAPKHLSYTEMEGYVDGMASVALRDTVENHILTCPECAAELRGLAAEHRKTHDFRWRWSRGLGRLAAVSLAVAAVSLLVIVFVTRSDRDSVPVSEAGVIEPYASLIRDARQSRTVWQPSVTEALVQPPEVLLGVGKNSTSFSPLHPLGEIVESVQPTFQWSALPGAKQYVVEVYDASLRLTDRSPALQSTNWTPGLPLPRGAVYSWQITALGPKGKLTVPAPPAPEARFQVLDSTQADELAAVRQANPDNHLLLGLVYAKLGLRGPARIELERFQRADSDSALAKALIESLQNPAPTTLKPAQ